MHFFPEPDDPKIASFVQAFVRLMFAHAEFERRVSDLQGLITGDPKFGEQPKSQRGAHQRPKLMIRLIKNNEERLGRVPEAGAIAGILKAAIAYCHRRNLLAHGTWWRLDPVQQVITVRSGIDQPGQEQHVELTVGNIDAAAKALVDLEVQLYRLQAAIRERLPQDALPEEEE